MSTEENLPVPAADDAADAASQPLPNAGHDASADTASAEVNVSADTVSAGPDASAATSAETVPAAPETASADAAPVATDAAPAADAATASNAVPAAGETAATDAAAADGSPAETPATPAAAAPTAADAKPETAPAAIELPPELAALDEQVEAALKSIGRGANRLSKLAGNIRFSFLQRDEARLANERKSLKAGFARQEKSEAELKFGLQTVLQKAERMAASLLFVPPSRPATPASAASVAQDTGAEPAAATETAPDAAAPTDADAPQPALPIARSAQIRQSVRKAMMGLAPGAPLHLQIELSPEFSDAEPNIMAMAARVHALHRQVLGSLKSIHWHSPLRCTLGFEDGRTLALEFGDQGIKDLPAEFRQNLRAAQPSGKPAAGQPGKGHGRSQGRNAQRQGQQRRSEGKAARAPGDGQQAEGERKQQPGGKAHQRPAQHRHGEGRNRRAGGDQGERGGNSGEHRSEHPRNRPGHRDQAGSRPAQGSGQHRAAREHGRPGRRGDAPSGNRAGKSFPGNSAMADKLREALGGSLKLPAKKKEGSE